MFDKNNWYIEEKELTDEQYQELCKFLVENYENGVFTNKIKGVYEEGIPVSEFCSWDLIGVGNGRFTSDDEGGADNPLTGSGKAVKITYQDFVEHLLNPSKMDSEDVSESPDTNPQVASKTMLGLVGICKGYDVTLEFTQKCHVNVYSDFGEWYVDLTEENAEEQLLKILEAVKVLNEADKL